MVKIDSHTLLSALHTHHYHDALLLQFILEELILAQAIVEKIEEQLSHPKSITKEILFEQLTQLVGYPPHPSQRGMWHSHPSILVKLKNYSMLLSQKPNRKEDKTFIALHHATDEAWFHYNRALSLLQGGPRSSREALTLGNHELHKIQKYLKKIIIEHPKDENILFYIIRNRDRFDAVFGAKYVSKLMAKLFPKGKKDALQFLLKRYTKRGFQHLEPLIEQCITEC